MKELLRELMGISCLRLAYLRYLGGTSVFAGLLVLIGRLFVIIDLLMSLCSRLASLENGQPESFRAT